MPAAFDAGDAGMATDADPGAAAVATRGAHHAAHVANAPQVIAWARSSPRAPASAAFTDGAELQAACWIEWAWSNAMHSPRLALQREGQHPAPCSRSCQVETFEAELRRLRALLRDALPQVEAGAEASHAAHAVLHGRDNALDRLAYRIRIEVSRAERGGGSACGAGAAEAGANPAGTPAR